MKKQFLTIACCAALLSISTTAYSAEGLYLSGDIGSGILSDSDITDPSGNGSLESNAGLALGVAVGYDYGNNIRAELEIAYQKNDADKFSQSGATGDTSNTALLLNGYYDFKSESTFIPFITGGLGFASVSANNLKTAGGFNVDGNDTAFAYQLGLGVGYAINEKVIVDLNYRYFATSDPKIDTATAEYKSNNIYIGVRVGF